MSSLGAGIALNEDFDFEVDATGDLSTVSELAELEKDVAFNITRNLDEQIGRRLDNSARKRIQVEVQNALINDDRINVINALDVRQVRTSNKFEVVADVNTADGPFDLVFEVNA